MTLTVCIWGEGGFTGTKGSNPDAQNIAEDAIQAFTEGFFDYFKAQFETAKGILNGPLGSYLNFMKETWSHPIKNNPAIKMIKSEIDTVTGVWSDILSGNLSGVSYRMGQNTAMGVEMLVVNAAGKVVGKVIVEFEGTLSKSTATNPSRNAIVSTESMKGKGGMVEGVGKSNFGSAKKLEGHFTKHGGEFKGVYNNSQEYLKGAQDVMQNGYKIQYTYKGEVRTGYVRFIESSSRGVAKFEFVGTNTVGEITTYHVESGKDFWKMINGARACFVNPSDCAI